MHQLIGKTAMVLGLVEAFFVVHPEVALWSVALAFLLVALLFGGAQPVRPSSP